MGKSLREERGRSRASRRSMVAVAGLVLVVALVAVAGLSAHTSKFILDHYECYMVKPFQSFQPREVDLKDQFGERKAAITGSFVLCNPVSKNGAAIRRKDAHLLCYLQKPDQNFAKHKVTVANQFGRGNLNVVAPASLCLPSGKSKSTEPQPSIPERFDHYACYLVKPASNFPQKKVKLSDQFWTTGAATGQPVRLCNPVSKNGGQIVNSNDHLVCYPIKTSPNCPQQDVRIANQFEPKARYTAYKPVTLCVPSIKREVG